MKFTQKKKERAQNGHKVDVSLEEMLRNSRCNWSITRYHFDDIDNFLGRFVVSSGDDESFQLFSGSESEEVDNSLCPMDWLLHYMLSVLFHEIITLALTHD